MSRLLSTGQTAIGQTAMEQTSSDEAHEPRLASSRVDEDIPVHSRLSSVRDC